MADDDLVPGTAVDVPVALGRDAAAIDVVVVVLSVVGDAIAADGEVVRMRGLYA